MPTYQYRCTECGHAFEAVQSFTDDALTDCPQCTGRLRKVFNSVGIVFKGSGFYRTDSREKASAGAGQDGAKNGSKDGAGSSAAKDGGTADSTSGSKAAASTSGSGATGSSSGAAASSGSSASSSSSSSSTSGSAA